MFGFFVCGPPGTGKSTHIKEMLNQAKIRGKHILIDPDLQEADTHAEKSKLALQRVKETITAKKSFVYVATCGGVKQMMSFLSSAKSQGFRTVVAIPYTTLSTALKRISQREQVTPEEVSQDLHAFFATKAEAYMKIKNLDEVYLYNNETDFNLLYSRKKKKIVCTPGEFYFDVEKYC
jgi:predicted kinase